MLTSNGTRELSDALRRRCLYHYVDYPDVDREARIILARVKSAGATLALAIARMVEAIRKEDLRKVPGVPKRWIGPWRFQASASKTLGDNPEIVHETLLCLLKTREDRARISPEVTARLLGRVA